MVKKLKYLLFFVPFLFTLNVNAMLLGTPNSFAHFDDDSLTGPSNATIIGYWGSNNYYKSPYLMGGVSAGSYVKQIDFNWNNANLCPNDDISISGSVAGLYYLFNEQSTSFLAYNNSSAMACTTSIQESGSRLDFSCYGKGGGTLSMYVQMNSFSSVKQYDIGVTRDMTVTCDASNLDVIQNATANTNSIINNNNQNTNTIVDNNNQNTDKIIENQNENFKTCSNVLVSSSIIDRGTNIQTTYSNGNLLFTPKASGSGSVVSSYYSLTLSKNQEYTFKFNKSSSGLNLVTYVYHNSMTGSNIITTSTENSVTFNTGNYTNILIGFYVGNSSYTTSNSLTLSNLELIGCVSKLDQQTDAINGLNDSITSEITPNTNQDINDMNNMVASDTPISDLITMPLTLINAYINGVGASCSPVNLGSLLGTNLTIPCINVQQHIGSNLWNTIDILCCIFLCYEIAMLFISAFDGITSLRDDFEGLYQPKHAYTGYVAKHGGDN